ncbi:MAG TPA: DinB family protein [Pyrinomonadaceae bacterium]
MNKWKHLFVDGEFAARERILSGLTLEQVTRRLSPQSHTIYEELWHTTRWQNIVVNRDEEDEAWQRGEVYPPDAPASEREWSALVEEFLAGLDRALEWADSPEKLAAEIDPDFTMADALRSLAVHNAHHLGKILALRQALGAWSPGEQKEPTTV